MAGIALWLVLAACCVVPIGWLVGCIVARPQTLSAAMWDAWTWRLLAKTLLLASGAGLLATLLSLSPAVMLGTTRCRFLRAVMITVVSLPILTPSIVLGYGWTEILFSLKLLPYPQGLADHVRCVWMLATWLWPIPCGVIALALSNLDRDLVDQARLDGALARALIRRLAPALSAAVLLATLLAMQEFSVFESSGISVLSTEIRMIFETGRSSAFDNPISQLQGGVASQLGFGTQVERSAMALGAGIPAIVLLGVMLLVATRLIARDTNALLDTDPAPPPRLRSRMVTLVAGVVIVIALGVPLVGLVQSLPRPFNPLAIAHDLWPQMKYSLLIAAGSGAVALAMALLTAVLPSRLPLWVAMASFLVGGQFAAIALLRVYGYHLPALGSFSPMRLVLDSNLAVVFAHVGRFGWIALLAGLVTHAGDYRSLRQQAAIDGAGPVRTALAVVLPRAWPVLLAAALLVATLSLTEVPAAALLTPPSLVPMLMTMVHMQRYGAMVEASLMLVCVVAFASVAIQLLLSVGSRSARRGVAVVLIGLACMGLSGCGEASSQPQAIWLGTGDAPGQVVYPRAITHRSGDDTFFVVDRQARVQHIDSSGKVLHHWRMPEWAQGKPVGLSVGPDGNLWVPDTHYHRILVYTPDGVELKRFGSRGTGPGEFDLVTDIAWDSAGNIYVSEYGESNRVQVFDKNFNFLRQIGRSGFGHGEFQRPQSIAIVGDELYVADACNHRIQVFTLDGQLLRQLGQSGGGAGEFRFPFGLEVDPDGHLLVTEFGNMRVQKIDRTTGQCLGQWGTPGKLPGQLMNPWATTTDNTGRLIIVDAGNNRLQVIAPTALRLP